mmetsp:Transcript_99874/g.271550  ORF Transcript_99874/g.271550 Transcript_99874/m.271550 type:complete len:506 (-) Transcript_99874:23-1540(-)
MQRRLLHLLQPGHASLQARDEAEGQHVEPLPVQILRQEAPVALGHAGLAHPVWAALRPLLVAHLVVAGDHVAVLERAEPPLHLVEARLQLEAGGDAGEVVEGPLANSEQPSAHVHELLLGQLQQKPRHAEAAQAGADLQEQGGCVHLRELLEAELPPVRLAVRRPGGLPVGLESSDGLLGVGVEPPQRLRPQGPHLVELRDALVEELRTPLPGSPLAPVAALVMHGDQRGRMRPELRGLPELGHGPLVAVLGLLHPSLTARVRGQQSPELAQGVERRRVGGPLDGLPTLESQLEELVRLAAGLVGQRLRTADGDRQVRGALQGVLVLLPEHLLPELQILAVHGQALLVPAEAHQRLRQAVNETHGRRVVEAMQGLLLRLQLPVEALCLLQVSALAQHRGHVPFQPQVVEHEPGDLAAGLGRRRAAGELRPVPLGAVGPGPHRQDFGHGLVPHGGVGAGLVQGIQPPQRAIRVRGARHGQGALGHGLWPPQRAHRARGAGQGQGAL